MSNLYAKKTGFSLQQSPLDMVIAQLTDHHNSGQGFAPTKVGRMAFGLEALNSVDGSQLSTALEEFQGVLSGIASTVKSRLDFNESQIDAGRVAGMIASDAAGFLRAPIQAPSLGIATESMAVVSSNVADGFTKRLSMEAYDEKDNRNTAVYSVAYNMNCARQDEFGEAFFPTIVVTPDSLGYSVAIRLIQVYDDYHRSTTGALAAANKRNIIQAQIDATILKNDLTKVIPVYRVASAASFVAQGSIATYNYVLEGETIPTSPLLFGKAVDLIGLSQTDTLLANGVMDTTDSLDPAMILQNIYIASGATGSISTIKFNTQNLPLSNFAPSPQNLQRVMNLNFSTTSLLLNAATVQIDGTALTGALAAIATSNLIVRVGVTVTGNTNLELGTTNVFANAFNVVSVQNSNGDFLDMTTSPAAPVVAALNGSTALGYDLLAYRTNLNRRQRGQLLDTSLFTQLYGVPLRSPISIPRPVTTDGSTDSSDLSALITATHIRTSNAAVTKLLETDALLTQYVDARDTQGVGPDVLGVARFLLRPTHQTVNLDLSTAIDSRSSHERVKDIQAVLVNQIRDLAYRMYRDSGYTAAANAMAGGQARPPTVIIGTDPLLVRYLMVDGDLRTLGGEFDVRLVHTLDSRMSGKIAVTFGQFDGAESAANPLHFGNMAWKPELTVAMPISRGGQTSKELTVQPSFLHVVNLPILAMISVTNIPAIVASKVSVNFHTV